MSDRSRAAVAIAKVLLSLVAGAFLGYFWLQVRGELDEFWVPYAAGIITAVMVYVLLSRLGKTSAD